MGLWADNPEVRKPYQGPGDVLIRILPHKGKRSRSASRHRQRLMKDGMSADEFIAAVKADAEHLARVDLSHDVIAGFIALVPGDAIVTRRAPRQLAKPERKTQARK
jgi:hypothetical protein